jgi:phosphatidylinositol glycan class B
VFALFAVDTAYYGRPTFTPLNFVKANMAVSSYYGVSSWPFYFVQALPILCTTTLPFVLVGVYRMLRTSDPRHKTLLTVVAGTIAVYSLGPHKEWRFIHPLLPLLHVCAAKTLQDMAQATHQLRFFQGLPAWRTQLARLALLILNIPAILYVMFLHGRAQISVMYYLRGIPPTELVSVGFLMPCHSTPWQSHLHRLNLASTGRMWALTCEPPLKYVSFPIQDGRFAQPSSQRNLGDIQGSDGRILRGSACIPASPVPGHCGSDVSTRTLSHDHDACMQLAARVATLSRAIRCSAR